MAVVLGLVAMPVGAAEVRDVRIGEHPDMTRVVLDVDGDLAFAAKADPVGRSVRIELPGAVVRAPRVETAATGIVRRYAFEGEGRALTLAIEGAALMRVAQTFRLSPDADGGHRIVFDLVRADDAAPQAPAETEDGDIIAEAGPVEVPEILAAPVPARVAEAPRPPPREMTVDEWLAGERRPAGATGAVPTTTGRQALPSLLEDEPARLPRAVAAAAATGPDPDRGSPTLRRIAEEKDGPELSVAGDLPYRVYGGASFGLSWIGTNIEDPTGTAKLETEDSGYKVFGGVLLSRYVGVEAFYADLGQATLTVGPGDTVRVGNTTYLFTTSAKFTASITSVGAAGVFGLDASRPIRPYLKAGLHRWSETDKVTDSSAGTLSVSDGGFGPMFGVGLRVRMIGNLGLRGEYEAFGGAFGSDANYIHFVSAGLEYGF